MVRNYHHLAADAAALAVAKADRVISVCLPARDEQATVGSIAGSIVTTLTARGGGIDLVGQVLVVDDSSSDATAAVARQAGAQVVSTASGGGGKGAAMRMALEHAVGDLVVFVDADIVNFAPHFVTGLLVPLLLDDDVALVKGWYERPLAGQPGEGGRVTELMAKPVLELLFPHLSAVRQPLAGETAAPRTVFEKLELADGYGVEIGILLDVADRFGTGAIAQVDLGTRVHRNRPLAELRPQAVDVLRTALRRSGISVPMADDDRTPSGGDSSAASSGVAGSQAASAPPGSKESPRRPGRRTGSPASTVRAAQVSPNRPA